MSSKLIFNGKLVDEGKVHISPDNRSFRYGDGFFETIKVVAGNIQLAAWHFERLFTSMDVLQFQFPARFDVAHLTEQILSVVKANGHASFARVRLTVFRGDGGLFDEESLVTNYIIQSWPLNVTAFNENGLVLDIFKQARKACDHFSHIKSNNYLSYAMAALWAKQEKLNDAIVLNMYDRIADTSIANIWIVKDGVIKTPALAEGCVNGIMRRYILSSCRKDGLPVEESAITIDELLQASEVFVTNAIQGIRWVKQVNSSEYPFNMSKRLFNNYLQST